MGKTYEFRDLKDVLAKANEEKTGDRLAGLAAETAQERVAAKVVTASLLLSDLREHPAVAYEDDEVTRIIQDDVNEPQYNKNPKLDGFGPAEWILDEKTTGADIRRLSRGLTSEMVAAVAKLMSNLDLIYAAQKIRVTAHCNTTIGLPGTLSCRLQPNHTTDDPDGILASTLEGPDLRRRGRRHRLKSGDGFGAAGKRGSRAVPGGQGALEHPHPDLRSGPCHHPNGRCGSGRTGRPDLPVHCRKPKGQRSLRLFRQNAGAGPGHGPVSGHGGGTQRHVLRDRPGLGLSSEAHFGTDQVTMEARCYGFAKRFAPFLVNTVVGFIGPEYLYDARQVT